MAFDMTLGMATLHPEFTTRCLIWRWSSPDSADTVNILEASKVFKIPRSNSNRPRELRANRRWLVLWIRRSATTRRPCRNLVNQLRDRTFMVWRPMQRGHHLNPKSHNLLCHTAHRCANERDTKSVRAGAPQLNRHLHRWYPTDIRYNVNDGGASYRQTSTGRSAESAPSLYCIYAINSPVPVGSCVSKNSGPLPCACRLCCESRARCAQEHRSDRKPALGSGHDGIVGLLGCNIGIGRIRNDLAIFLIHALANCVPFPIRRIST